MVHKYKNGFFERRRFIRHAICYPLEYEVSASKLREQSTTINISEGGLLFSSKHLIEVGTPIVIKLPFRDKLFKVKAKVVHVKKDSDANLYNIGVAFFNYPDAFKVKLIEQLYLINEYRDLRSLQTGKEISLQDASKEWIKRYSDRFSRLYW